MKVVGEQARTEHEEFMARVAQLKGDPCDLRRKLDGLKRCKNATDSWQSLLNDRYNSFKPYLVRGGVCREETL